MKKLIFLFPIASPAFAQEAAKGITANPYFNLVPFVLIFVVFYFFILRPQQKKQKEHQSMLSELKRGDQVVTLSGIYGRIEKLTDDSVMLEVAEKVRIRVERQQVSRLVEKTTVPQESIEKIEK